jgi:hypothetical protein
MAPSESVLSEPPTASTLNEPTLGRGAPLQPETDRLVVYAESRADLESALGRTELTPVGIEPVPGQSYHWFVIAQGADPEGLDARVSSRRAEPVVDSGFVAHWLRHPPQDEPPASTTVRCGLYSSSYSRTIRIARSTGICSGLR